MAQLQSERAEELAASCPEIVVEDTDVLTHRIWFREKYGQPHPELESMSLKGDVYLLCAPDLAWTNDPLREHPHKRQYLYDLYYNELKCRQFPFAVIRGSGPDRLSNALKTIDNFPF